MRNVFDRMVSGDKEASEHTGSSTQPPDTKAVDEAASTSSDVKEVTQELLKYGYLEEV